MLHIIQSCNGKWGPGGNERPESIRCPNQFETHRRTDPTHRKVMTNIENKINENLYIYIYNSMQDNVIITEESVEREGRERTFCLRC